MQQKFLCQNRLLCLSYFVILIIMKNYGNNLEQSAYIYCGPCGFINIWLDMLVARGPITRFLAFRLRGGYFKCILYM